MGKRMANAPVFYVLCQLAHESRLTLKDALPALHSKMKAAGYPDHRAERTLQFKIPQSADGGGAVEAPATESERYIFSDVQSTSGFIVLPNALSFHTTAYETFERFTELFERGLQIVAEVTEPYAYVDRLGLRYLDAVAPRDGETLRNYLEPELLGLGGSMERHKVEAALAYSFSETVALEPEVGQVVARVMLRNSSLGFPADLQSAALKLPPRFKLIEGEHAVLDTDASTSERMGYDLQTVRQRLTELHSLVDTAFQRSVTDHARKIWREGSALV